MEQAARNLERVLNLEAQQGYKDKAVVGGIRQFATFWVSQAREEAHDESELALIEQIAEVLSNYSRLPGPEARQETITQIKNRLHDRPPLEIKTPAPVEVKEEKPPEQTTEIEIPPSPPSEQMVEQIEVQPDPEGLEQPVTALRGVGPKISRHLIKLGAETIGDLLRIYPRRYDDYTLMKPINRLELGEAVTVIGTVWEIRTRRLRKGHLTQATISDGTGSIQVTWFNQPWLTDQINAGMQIVLSGKIDQYLGKFVFNNPDWEALQIEPLRTRRIVPIYPLTKRLTAQRIREVMKRATNQWAPRVPELLPDEIRRKNNFYPLPLAIQQIHFPETQEALHQARRRLIFDELFLLQLGLQGLKREWQSTKCKPIPINSVALTNFIKHLPFELTHSQQRIIADIAADMAKSVPMNRLLQGDVGSGKTVIAAAAMVLATSAGMQAAMMAPTEILAEQHYRSLGKMLSDLRIDVALLTGSTPATEREELYENLASGKTMIVVGTHALIQKKVQIKNLGLAIVDEQHRFGVEQRSSLREKGPYSEANGQGPNPHLLVMSATPIPRTLALSLYGDLDLSILDEMPPGRQEIVTRILRPSERERAYAFVRSQIEKGRQAFIICPLVEESEKIRAVAAIEEHERLQNNIFPDHRLGLLHGRMPAIEKEAVMRSFHGGETNILVATSVIEVGIDVPNCTIMLIEGAERFGLAQLHQFRGRVGRGEHKSYCLLLADEVSADAEQRLLALEQTNDGFILAERDLELRGPGEFLGRRQSGLPELVLASLMDMEMLELARKEAQNLIQRDSELKEEHHNALRQELIRFWEDAADIS